ncbi:MAG: 16S rRNA (cytidine(1402)-2'-O)-methyltransferase [bacterium]
MSKFYVVATPIGNMGDITLRAIETLKSVDLILCEDTRMTKRLLDKYAISKPTMSYHAQSKLAKTDKIFELLEEGKNLALVSDAGTPGISDPGALLVSQIKERFNLSPSPLSLTRRGAGGEVSVEVVPIPGPTALITALSGSGLPTHEFTFLGFLPHKKGRETLFKEIAQSKRTVVFYESPHRILKTLESLVKFCPNKKVCVARELTKIYEEFKTGTPAEVLEYFNKNKDKVRGEFTVIVA